MNFAEFSTDELLKKIHYIQSDIDPEFRLILNRDWNSTQNNYRLDIRKALADNFTSYFTREQLALLHDLNWIPESVEHHISISHCRSLGGFAVSKFELGFDVEQWKRISTDILRRTCEEEEFNTSLRPEFLWVAKEAGVKALSKERGHRRDKNNLVVTDLITHDWSSHFENRVFSFRLKSEKALDFGHNKGYVFLEGDELFCIYFS